MRLNRAIMRDNGAFLGSGYMVGIFGESKSVGQSATEAEQSPPIALRRQPPVQSVCKSAFAKAHFPHAPPKPGSTPGMGTDLTT